MASLAVAVSPHDVEVLRTRDEIVHEASMHGMRRSWLKARRAHYSQTRVPPNDRKTGCAEPPISRPCARTQAISMAAADEDFAERATTEAKWIKVKAKDRKCNTSKPRQGWTKSQMRLFTVRMCVCCRGLMPREVRGCPPFLPPAGPHPAAPSMCPVAAPPPPRARICTNDDTFPWPARRKCGGSPMSPSALLRRRRATRRSAPPPAARPRRAPSAPASRASRARPARRRRCPRGPRSRASASRPRRRSRARGKARRQSRTSSS